MQNFIGIEIGGTKLQIVTGDETAKILQRFRFVISKDKGAEGIRAQIEQTVREMCRETKITVAGVGFGGPFDRKTGKVACSHQIEGWSAFPFCDWLRDLCGAPVIADNDANVAALGEAIHGAGKTFESVFYVTLGSGVGGGLVSRSKIFHGASPGESEIGHLRVDRDGLILEDVCSGWAVDEKIRTCNRTHPTSLMAKLVGNETRSEARFLKGALAAGDPEARRILDETAETLAFGLSHVVHLFHPEVIVLGGGLSLIGEPLRTAAEKFLPEFLMKVFSPSPEIVLSTLGEDAVPIGALELAVHHAGLE